MCAAFVSAQPPPPFAPTSAQAEHKISGADPLVLELQKVPKLLGELTSVWAPHATVVSFKLETDEEVLLTKVRAGMGQDRWQTLTMPLVTINAICADGTSFMCLGDQRQGPGWLGNGPLPLP